jgi:N-methylhydantoinase B
MDMSVHPITAEIIRHTLLAIPNQIDVNITRTAYSPLVYEYKDYAVGIVDAEGRLISQSSGGIPLFVANALGTAVRDGLDVQGRETIRPGDVIFSNDPATLGQHLNNVVMYTPVFTDADGRDLFGFMAVLVHWIDIGGMVPGSCAPVGTREIFQEGIQFRSVKLWSAGQRNDDIYRIIECNTRLPKMLMGDVESQLAGCLKGRDLIAALIARYGADAARRSVQLMWNRSEQAARDAVRALPDGTYTAESFLDNDGAVLDRNVPVRIAVHVRGDEMTVDFSDISEQVVGSINSGREGGAVTVARIAFKYLVSPDEPVNDGMFRPLRIVIPDGKFLSAAPTAPMSMYSTPLPTVIDTVMRAMVQAAPDRLAAGHHSNFGIHNLEGTDPRNGERYFSLSSMQGGWGALRGHDGPGPYKTMSHGDTLDVPAEAEEVFHPVCIESHGIRADSAGAGTWRGGLGLEKVIRLLAPATAQINVERSQCPPWGVLGGGDAPPPAAFIERPDQDPQRVMKGAVPLQPGDRIHMFSAGGGGYGNPLQRDPARVAQDVRLGYVSRDSAALLYGVVLNADGSVNEAATRQKRQST